MNTKIIVFNGVFYLVTFFFYFLAKENPSSSLGYGFFIIGFWMVSLITLIILLIKKIIRPVTLLNKIGILTATPVICIILISFISKFNKTPISEWYFDKEGHRYKVNTFNYSETSNTKRIKYYKSVDTVNPRDSFVNIEKWVKDSTWIYFSKSGDTTKIVRYKNDKKMK